MLYLRCRGWEVRRHVRRKSTLKCPKVRSDFCDSNPERELLSVPAKGARSFKGFTETSACPEKPQLFTVLGIMLGAEIGLITEFLKTSFTNNCLTDFENARLIK
jgi:hypothetical protein